MSVLLAIFFSILVTVNCQRPSYAGNRPSGGHKNRLATQSSNNAGGVGNRVDVDSSTVGGTTTRLPYDANGDEYIVNHFNNLPLEQRPFWILNQAHIEQHRGTPQQAGNNAGTSSTSTIPSNNVQQSTNSISAGNGGGVSDRFNTNNNFNPYNQLPNIGNPNFGNQSPNIGQFQEVVYPSNVTPDQRVQLEIQYLQNRLEALQRQRQQTNPQQSSTQNGQFDQQGQQLQ